MVAHRHGGATWLAWQAAAWGRTGRERGRSSSTSFSFDVSVWELFGRWRSGARAGAWPDRGADRDSRPTGARRCAGTRITQCALRPRPAARRSWTPTRRAAVPRSEQWCSAGEALSPALLRAVSASSRRRGGCYNLYGPTEAAVGGGRGGGACPERGAPPDRRGPPRTRGSTCWTGGRAGAGGGGGGAVRRRRGGGARLPGPAGADGGALRPRPVRRRAGGAAVPHGRPGRGGARTGTIEYLGRNDFQVKVRGFRVELGEIEARLREHPAVREAVVAGARGEPRRPAAGGVLRWEKRRSRCRRCARHLGERLPEHMVPAAYVRLERLPLTPNGKLDREGAAGSGGRRVRAARLRGAGGGDGGGAGGDLERAAGRGAGGAPGQLLRAGRPLPARREADRADAAAGPARGRRDAVHDADLARAGRGGERRRRARWRCPQPDPGWIRSIPTKWDRRIWRWSCDAPGAVGPRRGGVQSAGDGAIRSGSRSGLDRPGSDGIEQRGDIPLTLQTLLATLAASGIPLRGDGEEIVVTGNARALDTALVGELRAHKAALRDLVRAHGGRWAPRDHAGDAAAGGARPGGDRPDRGGGGGRRGERTGHLPAGAAAGGDPLPPPAGAGGRSVPAAVAVPASSAGSGWTRTWARCRPWSTGTTSCAPRSLWEGLPEPVQVVWRRARLAVEEVELDPAEGDAARALWERFDPRRTRLDVRRAPLMRACTAHDAAEGRWLLLLLKHHLVGRPHHAGGGAGGDPRAPAGPGGGAARARCRSATSWRRRGWA